ncbi:Spx/MgsR family RNA polymerase-binding regulatory protein [Cohnella yongneupensis]|uniref:Spx/MgsR family RNA polymerase-binding regulatory protein n=1 Tax=Cohnella yongneupensis TaxID=425006 RepID=A0ABW0QWS3_9BACL
MTTETNLKIYHLPTCSTCKLAIKTLKQHGYTLDDQDIREQPPTVEELSKLIPLSGLPIGKWFNTSGDAYRELGLKDKMKTMSEADKIALLSSNGMLIKRPVVSNGSRVTVGHREPDFGSAWGQL